MPPPASAPSQCNPSCYCCACAADPHSFGEELVAALICSAEQNPGQMGPHQQHLPALPTTPAAAAAAAAATQEPAVPSPAAAARAGRAALVLSLLLRDNSDAQSRLLSFRLSADPVDSLLARCVALLRACAARWQPGADEAACAGILRLLLSWCAGCPPASSALLAVHGAVQLLSDLLTGQLARGSVHCAGALCCAER